LPAVFTAVTMVLAQKKVSMKAIKAKRVSTVARGKFARALVLRGKKVKTVGGLTREALTRNRRGKIVSKRASAAGKRRYHQVEDWVEALMSARKALHVHGFVAVNGRTLQGKALYVKTKAVRAASRSGCGASSSGTIGVNLD